MSEARPLDRLRARKFQMNSSTLLFTPGKGSCRQGTHAGCAPQFRSWPPCRYCYAFKSVTEPGSSLSQVQVIVQASIMPTSLMIHLKVCSGTGRAQWEREIDDKPLKGDNEAVMETPRKKHETH